MITNLLPKTEPKKVIENEYDSVKLTSSRIVSWVRKMPFIISQLDKCCSPYILSHILKVDKNTTNILLIIIISMLLIS